MVRIRTSSFLVLAVFAVPLWVASLREFVATFGATPLLAIHRESASPPLNLLRWSLRLSPEQTAALDRLVNESASRLGDLSAELISARMAASLTTPDAPAASRRQRELARAEAALVHEQNLLERRLRGQLTPEQFAQVERWEERARRIGDSLAVGVTVAAALPRSER